MDPETLAAYIDGRLPPEARARVEAEIAADPDVHEWLVTTMGAVDALQDLGVDSPVTPLPAVSPGAVSAEPVPLATLPVRRALRHAAAGVGVLLAAAAALLLVVRLQPSWWQELWAPSGDPGFASLVAAVGEERYLDARLTGGFKFGPLREATRGTSASSSQNLRLLAAAGVLQQAAERDPSAANLHAWGVAQVLLGDLQAGIAVLEPLSQTARSAAVLSDLAAAYIAAAEGNPAPHLWPRALEAAQASCELDPTSRPAFFNRALALENLGLTAEAVTAWEAFLAVETDPDWRNLASARLAALTAKPSTAGQSSVDELIGKGRDRPARLGGLRGLLGGAAVERSDDQLWCALQLQDTFDIGAMSELPGLAADCLRRLAGRSDDVSAFVRLYAAIGSYYTGHTAAAERLAIAVAPTARAALIAGRSLYVLAGFRFAAGDFQGAMALLTRCLQSADPRDLQTVAGAHQMSAEVLRAVGQADAAWAEYLAVAPVLAQLPVLRRHAYLYSAGIAAIGQDLPGVAAVMYRAAAANAEGPAWAAPRAEAEVNKARAHLLAGDVEAASLALASAESVLARVTDPAIAERLSLERAVVVAELSVERGDRDAVTDIDATARRFANRGLQFRAGLFRALAARSALAESRPFDALQQVELGLAAVEAESSTLASDISRRSHLDKVWDLYRLGALSALALGHDERALAFLERGKRVLADGAGPATLRPTGNEAYVVFATLQGRLFRWDVVGDGIRAREIVASTDDLERALSVYRRAVSGASNAPIDREMAYLGATLLDGLEAFPTSATQLVIVADGPVAGSPFAALPLPVCRCPVMTRFATAYSSSIAAYQRSAARPRATLDRVAFFADAEGSDRLRRLPFARSEVEAAAAWYPDASVFTGEQVTRPEVVAALRAAGLVHFAGHAIGDGATPWLSGLMVSDTADSWLSARDFPPSAAQLVILAACDTSYSARASGPGVPGLATLLMERGAKAVIGTLAPIRDRSAARFFVALHREIASGVEPLTAVRRTQRAMRDADPGDWSWSAVVLFGT